MDRLLIPDMDSRSRLWVPLFEERRSEIRHADNPLFELVAKHIFAFPDLPGVHIEFRTDSMLFPEIKAVVSLSGSPREDQYYSKLIPDTGG